MEQKHRIRVSSPKLLMLLCMFLCSFTTVFAQKTVKGTVFDETGQPVIGANVLEKGTTNGRITDINGNFTLTVQDNAILVVSFIGYTDQEISTKGKTEFKITLKTERRQRNAGRSCCCGLWYPKEDESDRLGLYCIF